MIAFIVKAIIVRNVTVFRKKVHFFKLFVLIVVVMVWVNV